jgi:hypothetical protein
MAREGLAVAPTAADTVVAAAAAAAAGGGGGAGAKADDVVPRFPRAEMAVLLTITAIDDLAYLQLFPYLGMCSCASYRAPVRWRAALRRRRESSV